MHSKSIDIEVESVENWNGLCKRCVIKSNLYGQGLDPRQDAAIDRKTVRAIFFLDSRY